MTTRLPRRKILESPYAGSRGIASEVVTKTFKKAAAPRAVTATAVQHYVARRISLNEYLAYGQQFGFTTSFSLSLVNGLWVLAGPPDC